MNRVSKWEAVLELELKPKALEQQLMEEAAKLLAKELAEFPPPTGGFELEADAARFAPLYDEPRTRPAPEVYRAAFHLARLELLREFEEADAFVRHGRARALAPSPRDHLAMLLLSRWLSEQMLALADQLRTRLSRPKLAAILELAERRLLGTAPVDPSTST